ncbi:NAD+ synthase [Nakamurella silvestris]|nr:NAD+ synthase [Nakamurella silvestris]
MTTLRVALAQINTTVGDLDRNADLIVDAAKAAAAAGADVVVFPEMALTGYPVEDLALRPAFREASRRSLAELPARLVEAGAGDVLVLVGYLDLDERGIRNAAGALLGGSVVARFQKYHLPNYGVFDEARWFAPATATTVLRFRGVDIGVAICEDLWQHGGTVTALSEVGVDLLLSPNSSPFEQQKDELRLAVVREAARTLDAPVVYCNLVGGQDDLVFDGGSLVLDSAGETLSSAGRFAPQLVLHDLKVNTPDTPRPTETSVHQGLSVSYVEIDDTRAPVERTPLPPTITPDLSDEAELWEALVLGLRDYVYKIGFRSVVLGLSGGIDSAVVAAIAVDAIGAENVHGVSMPSEYSSEHSKDDAADMAERTGLHYRVEPIGAMVTVFKDQLGLSGLAEENLQARCRGVLLMALSNAEGHLVLATGNKSELACGYSTIYGDAVGGYAPLKDVFKVWVWRLASWRNEQARAAGQVPPIPENSITKPPSAELRPGQLDSDSLPDYEVLDKLLDGYVERDLSAADLVADGFDPEMVAHVVRLVDRAEWKRRQYPLGTKVSDKAFGRDRRLPITNRWDGD